MHSLGYFQPGGKTDTQIFEALKYQYGDYLEVLNKKQKFALLLMLAHQLYSAEFPPANMPNISKLSERGALGLMSAILDQLQTQIQTPEQLVNVSAKNEII